MNQPISKDIKDQILQRVREGKETVVDIAKQHGIKVNTVYGWISRGFSSGSPLLEISRLKKRCFKTNNRQFNVSDGTGKKGKYD